MNIQDTELGLLIPMKLNAKYREFNLIAIDNFIYSLTLFYPPYLKIRSKLIDNEPSNVHIDLLLVVLTMQFHPY